MCRNFYNLLDLNWFLAALGFSIQHPVKPREGRPHEDDLISESMDKAQKGIRRVYFGVFSFGDKL